MNNWRFEKIFLGFLIALIIATPLFFGSVHPWAYGLISYSAFFLLALGLIRAVMQSRFSYVSSPLFLFIPLVIMLFLSQVVPLPIELASRLSPGLSTIRMAAGLTGGTATLALYPWAAKGQAILVVSVLIIFFLVVNNIRTKQQISLLITVATLTGILLVFLALAQRVAIGKPSFLPFINRNHYAGYMELLVPMAAALCYANFSKVQACGGLRNVFLEAASKKSATLVLFYALAGTLFCFSTIMTYSRGGLFGMIFSLLVLLAMLAGRNRRWLLFAAVAAILVISVVLISSDEGKVFSHVEKLTDNDPSAAMRYETWRDTVGMIKKFPYVGVGLGGFETAFPSFKTIDIEANFYQPESDYLYTLAEAGFIGFALVIVFISTFLWKVLAMHRERTDGFARSITAGCVAGLAGLLVHGMVDTSLHLPAIMLLVAIFMGIAYVAAGTRFRRGRSGRTLLSRKEVVLNSKGKWAMSLCAVLSLLISGSALAGSASDLLYRSALNDKAVLATRRDSGPEDYSGLIKKLDAASLLDPGRSEYSFEKGRAYIWFADYAAILEKISISRRGLEPSRSYNEKALRCFMDSSEFNPYSSFPHLMAGRVLERGLGDKKGGEGEYRLAEALNPTNLMIKQYLAEDYEGKCDSAPARKYQTAADVTRVP